ncbi:TPA: hypothetical protein ACK3JW_001258, partial [Mannheimia haemolytica]
YTSPTIILSGVCLLFLFSNLTLKNEKLIKVILLLSSASFSVYLIHDNPTFRHYIISNLTKPFINDNIFLLLFKIFGIAISIYVIATIIDLFRQLFMKLIKINSLFIKLEQLILK